MNTSARRLSKLFTQVILVIAALVTSKVTLAQNTHFETIKIQLIQQASYLQLDAKVEPVKAATVAAQTSGRVLAVHYDVNDLVPEGAALLEITNKEQGAELAATEADLAKAQAMNVEAQAQFKRYQTLFPKGAISQGAMDEATANAKSTKQAVSAAQARLVRAKESVNYTVVSAPFTGRLTAKMIEQGETISYGQALLSGYATDKLRAIFYVPQQYRQQLNSLTTLSLSDDKHRYISEQINPFQFSTQSDHSIEVRAIINNPDNTLQAGQWLKVALPVAAKEVISIPKSALYQVGEMTTAYRKQQQRYLQTQIRLGNAYINDQGVEMVEVLAGVMPGDEIVLNATDYVLHLGQTTTH
ncbi:efflux RND transporter periplasmic adaptor subunit [Shewanella sp. OMA3-2]|uniref:efflux RND transporter periplasmic adaptor subunit n=1 Tax=Shewanella sp. OMA3-2 TaxID=2908650 RepID=UPI001F45954E|nr:efflux RND transporter periplasmic adaptor subunit [Shewanella sp. OMA3-2]UJF23177.1 efflux RND transporter periplasmic adaptor subunit [Shewanella sp. OMA3-2]